MTEKKFSKREQATKEIRALIDREQAKKGKKLVQTLDFQKTNEKDQLDRKKTEENPVPKDVLQLVAKKYHVSQKVEHFASDQEDNLIHRDGKTFKIITVPLDETKYEELEPELKELYVARDQAIQSLVLLKFHGSKKSDFNAIKKSLSLFFGLRERLVKVNLMVKCHNAEITMSNFKTFENNLEVLETNTKRLSDFFSELLKNAKNSEQVLIGLNVFLERVKKKQNNSLDQLFSNLFKAKRDVLESQIANCESDWNFMNKVMKEVRVKSVELEKHQNLESTKQAFQRCSEKPADHFVIPQSEVKKVSELVEGEKQKIKTLKNEFETLNKRFHIVKNEFDDVNKRINTFFEAQKKPLNEKNSPSKKTEDKKPKQMTK